MTAGCPGSAVALFAVGAFVASAAWQLLLVGGGSVLGRLLPGAAASWASPSPRPRIMLGLAVVVLVG